MLVSCFECKLYFSFCFYWEQIHQNAFQKFITINWMGERKWDIWCISMWETKKKRDERWTIALSSCFSRQPFDIMIIFYFWSNHFSWRFFMMFFFAWWDCIIFRAFDALKYIWFFQHSSMNFILDFKINSFFVCFINIQNGSVVMFGRVASYKFVDSPSDGRYNLVLSQSQLDSACLYER